MEAISLEGRRIRDDLERFATVNGYNLGYEYDGTKQIFDLMQAADIPELTVKGAALWSRHFHHHVKEGATLVLGAIDVPSGDLEIVDGVRSILASFKLAFDAESGTGRVAFSPTDATQLTNEVIFEITYRLQQEYLDSGIQVYLYAYVPNGVG